ncbi:MAG: hypothetical protein EOO39_00150 [Cytophagaceae bacterium]|nr:MAG: hypothetical protein EOO39_00150 [Cytophagaceae bacterium]
MAIVTVRLGTPEKSQSVSLIDLHPGDVLPGVGDHILVRDGFVRIDQRIFTVAFQRITAIDLFTTHIPKNK